MHIKMKNAFTSCESLLHQDIYIDKVLSIALILHIAKHPFQLQTFNDQTNDASEESGLITSCSKLTPNTRSLYSKLILPRSFYWQNMNQIIL